MSNILAVFDMNHPGIVLVHQMREKGMFEHEIQAKLLNDEVELQQRVNGAYLGKHIPRIPTQDDINKLRILEVACVYSSIDDIYAPCAFEKIAKIQTGINPFFGGATMSAEWQNRRDSYEATRKPTAKRHGTIIRFKPK